MKLKEIKRELVENHKMGRKPKLTEKILIQEIGIAQTSSPSALLEHFEKKGWPVARRTLFRYLKKIPQEIIDGILAQATEDELKPTERSFGAFKNLEIIQKYIDTMRHTRKVSPNYERLQVRTLHWICKALNKNPKALRTIESVELAQNLVMEIQKGNLKRNLEAVNTCLRSWYAFNGISGDYLTTKGITGERLGRGKRSRVKFTEAERKRFMLAVETHYHEDVAVKDGKGKTIGHINFKSNPTLRNAMNCLPKFLFYNGTRIEATLNAQWKDVTFNEPITLVHVIDKGKHKLGRIEWDKKIAGEFLQEFKEYWQELGCPQDETPIFPFTYDTVRRFFAQCYIEADIPQHKWDGMPCHIWRHTACQELLHASGWNEQFVADTLGWESKDTMEKSYGKASPEINNVALLQAMGLPVPEQEKKEFKF